MTTNDERDEDRRGGLAEVIRIQVELWLVVLFMALAFGAGIVVTALYDAPQTEPVVGTSTGGSVIAPPLSDDQISSGLPSGHPDIGAPTGATGPTGGAGRNGGAEQDAGP